MTGKRDKDCRGSSENRGAPQKERFRDEIVHARLGRSNIRRNGSILRQSLAKNESREGEADVRALPDIRRSCLYVCQ